MSWAISRDHTRDSIEFRISKMVLLMAADCFWKQFKCLHISGLAWLYSNRNGGGWPSNPPSHKPSESMESSRCTKYGAKQWLLLVIFQVWGKQSIIDGSCWHLWIIYIHITWKDLKTKQQPNSVGFTQQVCETKLLVFKAPHVVLGAPGTGILAYWKSLASKEKRNHGILEGGPTKSRSSPV